MPEPVQFSFTTAMPDGVVAALWDDSAVPAVAATTDTRAVNLGVRFVASEDLEITGVRFYKGPGNTGTHVGSLWSAAGELMAQATFTGESTNGWQQVLFDQPVTVIAGSTYVASYHAPVGAYAANAGYFTTDHTKGPLTAPALSGGVGNGVYRYGSSPAFPTTSFGATNYWVTPVYAVPPDLTAPTLAVTAPVDGTSRVRLDSVIRATFDEPVDPDERRSGGNRERWPRRRDGLVRPGLVDVDLHPGRRPRPGHRILRGNLRRRPGGQRDLGAADVRLHHVRRRRGRHALGRIDRPADPGGHRGVGPSR